MNETQKIPKAALCFMDPDCFAQVKGNDEGDQLTMVVYSGGLIKDHWWWDDLAIDLSGISFPKSRFPILENHDQSRKLAFGTKKPSIDSGALVINSAEFVDTPESEEFRKLSKQGFPYESSMYSKPTVVERVTKGAKVEVNGMTVTGPATVWRKCIFKEASVCVFGWDSNTKATAFANEEIEITVETVGDKKVEVKEVTHMKLEELREKHPELLVQIETDLQAKFNIDKEAMETAFAAEKADLETRFAQEKADLERDLATKLSERDERILKLEKTDTIRAENEREAEAGKIWSEKLANSDVGPELHEKVKRHILTSKFVKDGVFDKEAFATAVDAEIKDWEERLPHSSVLGGGFGKKGVVDEKLAAEDKADEKLADDIFAASGGKKEVE